MDKPRSRFTSGIPRPRQINKQILQKCMEVVKGKDDLTPKQMKEALTKIALELQRVQSDSSVETSTCNDSIYKTKLKMKRKQIKNLKENLNTACIVAKTLTSSKEKDFETINKHLDVSRNEAANLQKKNLESTKIIQKLNSEKQALLSKLQHLKSFIELGYKELQSIRKEEEKDLPLELQLREIIVSCGQYYADFSNEQDKCNKLEQKNRFLANKLIILERNLELAAAELDSQRSKSRTRENKEKGGNITKIGCVRSEYSLSQEINVGRLAVEPLNMLNNRLDRYCNGNDLVIDLNSHVSLVKDLMDDQDCMLSELKKLSEDLSYLTA